MNDIEIECEYLNTLKEIFVIREIFKDAKRFKYAYFEIGIFHVGDKFKIKVGYAKHNQKKDFQTFDSLSSVEYHFFGDNMVKDESLI